MRGYSQHNSLLIGLKNQVKFEHDRVSRQPNSMILVSFSIAEDALLNNDVKTMTLLDRRVLKIRYPAFLGHPL